MFERYTEAARRTLFFVRCEASQFGSTAIEPEHLLRGLLREPSGIASILERSGVRTTRPDVRRRGVRRDASS
jgi:hypothetical protein